MNATLGTMREFKTKHFTIIADAVEEIFPDLSWDDTGETERNINTGKWLCFTARVRVFFNGTEVGADYLGNCVYASFEDFMDHKECGKQNREWAAQGKAGRCGSYFADMIHEAIARARTELKKMQSIHIR